MLAEVHFVFPVQRRLSTLVKLWSDCTDARVHTLWNDMRWLVGILSRWCFLVAMNDVLSVWSENL